MATMLRMTGVANEVSRGLASRAGVGSGHAVWVGRSGRRHVFSRLEAEDGEDVGGAVLLLVRRSDDGEPMAERLVVAAERSPRAEGCEVWVHWLAETDAERLALIADLEFRPCVFEGAPHPSATPTCDPAALGEERVIEPVAAKRAA